MSNKVLVVDDDPVIRDLVKALLEAKAMIVCSAGTGQEGLDRLQSEKPDLIILDVQLPDMTGLAVCRKIRETSKIPIIMFSSKDQELDKVMGMEFGADDYVTKPCNPRELVARVRAQLRRWSSWQPGRELEVRRATLLYALLWNDRAYAETPLDELADQVVQFQELYEQVVSGHGGAVNSYSEDTAVALFPDTLQACRAALELHQSFAGLNGVWADRDLQGLNLGVGLHAGEIMLGDFSLSGEEKPALVGEEARKAATLSRLAQKLSVGTLLSPSATSGVGDSLTLEKRGEFSLKDGDKPSQLMELTPQ